MTGQYIIPLSESDIQAIATAMVHANEEVKEEVAQRGLISRNGSPGRFWDILNTELFKHFTQTEIVANTTRFGGWCTLPFLDKKNGVLYMYMSEKNFNHLAHMDPKERNNHYLASVSGLLNADLPEQQLCMFPMNDNFDEDFANNKLGKISTDLSVPTSVFHRSAVILFRIEMGQLRSLRCCAINKNFEIVESLNWSNSLPVADRFIVETSDEPNEPHNNPWQNLVLSEKSIKRKEKEGKPKVLSIESINKPENSKTKED